MVIVCLTLFAWRVHPEYRLVVASNRDEFHYRAAEPLHWWADRHERIAAGRDVSGGGTWLGVDAAGRFAAVTNVRQGVAVADPTMRSRGELPVEFLAGAQPPAAHVAGLDGAAYQGFNLLVADADELWWASNRSADAPQAVSAGVHGLSNAALDTDWPKVRDGVAGLTDLLPADDGSAAATERYLDLLADTRRAPWRLLPRTGVPRLSERRLSARFVDMGEYGTRSSTVLRIRYDGSIEITERRFGRFRRPTGETWLSRPARK